ncbi:MAG: hypothetical protein O7G84_01160 [Gammaproteobacteria bacterium]|nr:hypothetical protein [Gammaproteobacteria bacterium]
MEKSRVDGRDGRFIGGYISTDHMDRAGETLIQDGLDFEPFLKKGWFNDNHDGAGDSLVGYPTMVRLDNLAKGHKGWYVEGELLPDGANPRADSLWKIAQGLHKGASGRKLGFSVEGSILKRDAKDSKIVRKAEVREVAITRCPVNTQTSLDVLAKSLAVGIPAGEPGSAEPLQTEALEGVGTKKKKKKKLTKGAAVELILAIRPGFSRALAAQIVDYTARHHAA